MEELRLETLEGKYKNEQDFWFEKLFRDITSTHYNKTNTCSEFKIINNFLNDVLINLNLLSVLIYYCLCVT